MACTDCNDPCNQEECVDCQDCGCDKFYNAACVKFYKKDLPCIDVTEGTDLETIIEKIDERLCSVSDGDDGLSAYDIAVSNGFSGTEEEWLLSLNGDDCSCEEIVLYNEQALIEDQAVEGTIGTWTDITDISTATTVAVTPFTYTVPAGGDGNYELDLQGTLAFTLGTPGGQQAGIYADILIDGTPLAVSGSASTVYSNKSPYSQVRLFQSNMALTAGQTISVGLATNLPANVGLQNSKLQIKKLA